MNISTITVPLYDELKNIKRKTEIDVGEISSTINKLNSDIHYRNIFILILHHFLIEEQKKNGEMANPLISNGNIKLPYHGIFVGFNSGPKFRMEEIPNELKNIIGNYIDQIIN